MTASLLWPSPSPISTINPFEPVRKKMRRVASVNTINRLTKLQEGEHDTVDYRMHSLDHNQERISLWHELPLFAVDDDARPTGALNFICEIPKYTRRKFEICTTEAGNPIKQDEKNGKPRVFSKGDIFFNYGCFPRTWEDPKHVAPDVGVGGDNDPLDVCEIGLRQIPTGAVRQVKVLGVLCLIDDGEADWKIIAIDEEDRWARELNDIEDVERLLPGTLHAVREWFRTYKVPDGKPENRFALGERFMGVKYTMRVIRETHEAWKNLIRNSSNGSGLSRQLSVPSLDSLDMDSDHVAVSALLGPDGTPRILDPSQRAAHFPPAPPSFVGDAIPTVVGGGESDSSSRSTTPMNVDGALEF